MEKKSDVNLWMQVSEVELVYRSSVKPSQRPRIREAKDAYKLLRQTWDEGKIEFCEQVKILLLNRVCKVLGICELFSGGITETVMDIRMIFQAALKANSVNIIICHNHPGGHLEPSGSDIRITQKIKEAGALLDIKLLDHIIITSEGFYSFADERLL